MGSIPVEFFSPTSPQSSILILLYNILILAGQPTDSGVGKKGGATFMISYSLVGSGGIPPQKCLGIFML